MREWGGGKSRRREASRKRQGVHHKINPFTVSSGCKVRYEADMSNEMLQSSKGTVIKAYNKLMELVISGAIKWIEMDVLFFGDPPRRRILYEKVHFPLFPFHHSCVAFTVELILVLVHKITTITLCCLSPAGSNISSINIIR